MRNSILIGFVIILVSCQAKKSTVSSAKNPQKKDTLLVSDIPRPIKYKEYSLDYKIGQLILVGINGRKELDEQDSILDELKSGKIGGIILFEKNIATENAKEKLTKLIADLQRNVETPLFITIDEEGGKVHRLKQKYGFVDIPSAAALGKIDNADSTFFYTKRLASVMAEAGITVNFAPDVDVALNAKNPVIAKVERSYSENPDKVAQHALAAIEAHHVCGLKTAIKHFPGHGSSMTDSHLGITDVTKQWNESELIPFKKIIASGKCDAIMTAHIVNGKLDESSLPATMSKKIVTELLRNKLGYKGVVFSDDMQMYAISKNYGLENAIKSSINAGVDVLVFGNNVSPTDRIRATEIHAIISKLVQSGDVSEQRINESFDRIMALKEKKVN